MPRQMVSATAETKKTVVYVEGDYLYYGRLRGTAFKWLDLPAPFDHILSFQDPSATVETVKFFSAPALGLRLARQ